MRIILSLLLALATIPYISKAQLVSPPITSSSNDRLYLTVGGSSFTIPEIPEETIETQARLGKCIETRNFFFFDKWNNGAPSNVVEGNLVVVPVLGVGEYFSVERYNKGYNRSGEESSGYNGVCVELQGDKKINTGNGTSTVISNLLFEDGTDYLEYDLCFKESEQILIVDTAINLTSQGYFNEYGIISSDAYLATTAPIQVTGNGVISNPVDLESSVQQNPQLYYFDVDQAQVGDNIVTVLFNFHNGIRELTINFKRNDEGIISQSVDTQEVCLGREIEISDFTLDGDKVEITSEQAVINNLIREENGRFFFTAFDNIVSEGEYEIKITGHRGLCQSTVTRKIKVINLIDVQFDLPDVFCKDDTLLNLNTIIEPLGGVFTSLDIPNFEIEAPILDPKKIPPGTYSIKYSLNNGCADDVEKLFTVFDAAQDIQFSLPATLCKSIENDGINLFDYVNIKGGIFSSTSIDVSDGILNVSEASLGNHTIVYSVGNESVPAQCLSKTEKTITVTPGIPEFEFELPDFACQDIESLNLFEYLNSEYESYSIEFSRDEDILISNPIIWDIGTLEGEFKITCRIFNEQCSRSVAKTISILPRVPQIIFDLPESICQNSGVLNLEDLVNIKGGEFSSVSLTVSNGLLDPENVSLGTHFIEYKVTNEFGCARVVEKEITILQPAPDFDFSFPFSICQNEQGWLLNLDEYVTVKGGDFYLSTKVGSEQVINNLLDIKDLIGDITLFYSIGNEASGCIREKSVQLDILEAPTGVRFDIPDYCKENKVISLIDFVNVSNGEFTSNSTAFSSSDNTFDLSRAQVGEHVINFTVSNENGCDTTLIKTIRVGEFFPIEAGNSVTLCLSNPIYNLTGKAIPDGGVWSGTGVKFEDSGYIFNGNGLAPATFPMVYTYDNNGCIQDDTMSITIVRDDLIDFTADKTEIGQGVKVNFEANIKNARSYLWDFGQTDITSELATTSFIYHANFDEEERFFTVSLTVDLEGCQKEIVKPDYIRLLKEVTEEEMPLSLWDAFAAETVTYPNPFQSTLRIETPSSNFDLAIFNSIGQIVWQGSFKQGEVMIDTMLWPTGIYTLLFNVDNEFLSKKVVKR